jgi:hypothetical protein
LVKWAEVVECGGEESFLGACEISAGFGSEHFKRVDDGSCGAEVDLFFAAVGIGDLAEEKPGILGLEDDELIEPGIGFRRCGHGARICVSEKYTRENKGLRRLSSGRG